MWRCSARLRAFSRILAAALLCLFVVGASAQRDATSLAGPDAQPLRLSVDEVVLTFNATDTNGLPVDDLKAAEIRIRDNGVAPRRIVAFDELMNRPVRAGILLDTSESMQQALPENRAIATNFVERLFRQRSDVGLVAGFGFALDLVQPWTGNSNLLVRGIDGAREKRHSPGGTSLFGAVFRACAYSFNKFDPTATGNFILLFSDGEDNAGLTSLEEAAHACQRSNTEVFAFLPASRQAHASTGPKAVRELVAKTGGRVFKADDSEDAIWRDLKEIESEMRNQYRLVYNPADFKHDGAFHEIELQPPDRVHRIEVRSGYFAPRQ
jgi:Ca-activated chloride channel family protein